MDDRRFDHLARTLAPPANRRATLTALLGFGLTGIAPVTTAARKHKKKRCHPPCPDGMLCHRGTCVCPAPQQACGGQCYAPCQGLPASGQIPARHPVSCACCLRPGSFNCDQTGSLPCCARACDPLEAEPTCREFDNGVCHQDVECFVTQHCPPGNDPRACAEIPG